VICPVCGRRECGCLIDELLVGPEGVAAYLRAVDHWPRGNRCAARPCPVTVSRPGDYCRKHRPDEDPAEALAPIGSLFHKHE
jgi:hypothetical protein